MLLGLRTVVYYVSHIDQAKAWYNKAFNITPYFDTPFYVGYNVGGYELGLHPGKNATPKDETGAVSYWGVENIAKALGHLLSVGAKLDKDIQDVGDGVKVATVIDPFGNIIGIIENPYFSLAENSTVSNFSAS
ncbi:MAG: VOC family protein [Blastocatellia bacterium]